MMKLFALTLSFGVVSAGVCNDKRPDCSNWARDGECTGDNAVRSIAAPHQMAYPPLLLWRQTLHLHQGR